MTIDRRYSVAEGQAVKSPCLVATTANITLSGLQTIDGVALAENDRVLVRSQSTSSENGIYAASSGNWERARDFDGALDVVDGTRIFVVSGTVYARVEFAVTSSDPITIGDSAISFAVLGGLGETFADGSVAAPGMAFANEISTGFYRIGAGNVGLSVLGSKVIDIDASGLDVTGGLSATGASIFAAATFTGAVTLSATSYVKLPSGTTAQESAAAQAGRLRFNTTTSRLRIDYGSALYSVMTDAEKASSAEALTGTDDAKWVSPAGVKAAIDGSTHGSMVHLSTQAITGAASVQFTGIDGSYDSYELRFADGSVSVDGAQLTMVLGTGAGPTWVTSGYSYALPYLVYAVGLSSLNASSAASIELTNSGTTHGVGNAAGETFGGKIVLIAPSGSKYKHIGIEVRYSRANDSAFYGPEGGAQLATTTAVTGIKIQVSSGTLSGTFSLYGIKHS